VAGVRIERFDPAADETRLRDCYELVFASQEADDPNVPADSYRRFRHWWTHGWAGNPHQTWLAATASGALLGCYVLGLPERENRANGFLSPFVAPSCRRQGVGSALVAHAAEQAALASRTLLMSVARIGAPGHAFGESIGARPGMLDIRRVLDVGPALHARLSGLRAEAEQHSAGYTLRRWAGITPDELVGPVCALNAAMADAPHDDAYEPMIWDADRLRAEDERAVAAGARVYSVAAVQGATAAAAALTQVFIDPDVAGRGFQGITAVTREHRGHRLGLLVKVGMLEWLAEAEPGLSQIGTSNAAANEHMIAVNDKLGHRVSDQFRSFEMDVAAAKKLAADR
jgi:GNAT superfamily N-acetyltransferase/RimJ/RimL family protein N-acetyltransferase